MNFRERKNSVIFGAALPVSCQYAWNQVSRRRTAFERATIIMMIVLAVEVLSVIGLNADGIALLEFKKAITSDPHSALKNWNDSDATPCRWNGIRCARIQGTMEERVLNITLPGKELGGTLSPSLGDLVHLGLLNLHTNKLTGQIPSKLFAALNLSRLYLSNNYLTGDIPAEIRNLGNQLRVLEIRSNIITGLPAEIVQCSRLRRLILSTNNITGIVPAGIGSNLTRLERLDLSSNHFIGTIPENFANLTELQLLAEVQRCSWLLWDSTSSCGN